MSQTIPAEFHGVPLSIIDHAGQRWLTAQQIGQALGYSEGNTRIGIANLYGRHADEFTDVDTCVIKLITQGQMRETRIFSGSGCVLLGMFANTVRAKAFRVWAKAVLSGQHAVPVQATAAHLDLAREIGLLRDELRMQNGLVLDLYGKLDGARRGHISAQRGQLAAVRALHTLRAGQAVQEGIDTVIRMASAGIPREEIARATGKTRNYIRQIIFDARKDGRLPPPHAAQSQLALEG